jgi:predicted peptidase
MASKQQPSSIDATIQKNVSLPYLIYLPPEYPGSAKNWPLVVFLHGMGERGADLERLKRNGIPKEIATGREYPFIVVSPQCTAQSTWLVELDALHALIEKIIGAYQIDTSRIYLTGLSLGGFATWHLAAAYPSLFAAIVPICGGTIADLGFPERIKVLKDVPVWVFHGAQDEAVPLHMSQELVDVLQAHDGNVKFTVYPDVKHDSWTQTYANPELYAWLLQQQNHNFQLTSTLVQDT